MKARKKIRIEASKYMFLFVLLCCLGCQRARQDVLIMSDKNYLQLKNSTTIFNGFNISMEKEDTIYSIKFGEKLYHLNGKLRIDNHSILFYSEFSKNSIPTILFDSKSFISSNDSMKISLVPDFYLQIYREPNFIYGNDTINCVSLKVLNPFLLNYKVSLGFSFKNGLLFINYNDDCKEENIIFNERKEIFVHTRDKGCNLMEL